jgi:hypothetical protein
MNIDTGRYARCITPEDQKRTIIADLGEAIQGIRVMRNRVLVCTYVEAEMTPGGIVKPNSRIDESKWQGKVGLVLKIGPVAFEFDELVNDIAQTPDMDDDKLVSIRRDHGIPEVGDWVFFRGSDTWDCALRVAPGTGVHCRFINDDSIVGVIVDPSMIW